MFNYDMGNSYHYDSEGVIAQDGGPGSGNWGHGGRPGKLGGSTGGGGKQHRTGNKESGFSSEAKKKAEAKKSGGGGGESGKNSSKAKSKVKSVDNPTELKTTRPSTKQMDKTTSAAFKELKGEGMDFYDNTSIVEFPKDVTKLDVAVSISNKYRESGYETTFWKKNGTSSDTPTDEFSVYSKKGEVAQYSVYKDTDNSSPGKVYYCITEEVVY